MKMISKIAKVALGLVLVGSSVFAQSLDDAKKAIDAEKYLKAKSMLKNLTVTQATKDENFFYLGWVYLIQDYPDSAKEQFTKGLAVNPKSALNTAGLFAVAHANKDASGVNSYFSQAVTLAGRKDSKPFLYMGKAYIMPLPGQKDVSPTDATLAIKVLTQGAAINPKDDEIQTALGDANHFLRNGTDAYTGYTNALAINPRSLNAAVGLGVILEDAQNFDGAEEKFKAAKTIDPNFGPAYRAWAETDLYWAQTVKTVASAKVKEAVEHYKEYLNLTDESVESLLRYADFLYNAGDYATLQDVAAKLAKSASSNARVYRYIGYSAYETKDYAKGLDAMNTWFSKASPDRIISFDYLALGHLQIASGKDTAAGVANLKKYAALDTTKTIEVYSEIARVYSSPKANYPELIKTYQELISKVHGKLLLTEHLRLGNYTYNYFRVQARAAKNNNAIKADSSLLAQADTLLGFVQKNNPNPIYNTSLIRANIADERDKDIPNLKGYAKPQWDKVIVMLSAIGADKLDGNQKIALTDAYDYEGNYSLYHDKDVAKAEENYNKALALDPAAFYAKNYFANKQIQADNEAALKAAAEKAAAKKAGVKKP